VSTKFQNSNILLRILLHFACSETSRLPSNCGDPAEPTRSSLDTTSDSLITGFVDLSTFSAVLQESVEFSRVEVFHFLSDIPSLEAFNIRYQSIIFPLPSSPPSLEYSWFIRLAPLLFICNPSLTKSQSSRQQFGSTN